MSYFFHLANVENIRFAVLGKSVLICLLARINNSKHGNNKSTARKNKRKNFFPISINPYFPVELVAERVLMAIVIILIVFSFIFCLSPIFRIKVLDFIENIPTGCEKIYNQQHYGNRTEYYNQNNLSFADRRKRCNCDDNSVQGNEGRP